ncbi:MAG: BTAD domain-containing putative transcriptional regulator, partial [Gemmatimonadota bacterium]
MNRVEFRTFGTADLRQGDGTAVLSVLAQPKRVALLTYLAVEGFGDFVRRDTLCGAFWPDADQGQARHRLRSSLHMLRKALGHDALVRRGDEEIGVAAGEVWFDVEEFEHAVAEDRHEEALELYRGEFLAGFHVTASNEFDEWLRRTRERLQALAASSAKALTEDAVLAGQHEAAVRWSGCAREIAPLDEGALRAHMGALDGGGRRAEALREYDAFAGRLEAEIGASPAPESAELARRIRDRTDARPDAVVAQGVTPGSREDAPTPPADVVHPASSGRAAALTAAVALGGAAFFAARVSSSADGAAQPDG